MAVSSQTQRTLLFSFIASIALCGAIGAYILIIGQFGWYEARVLGTTAVIGGASILAMAAAVSFESGRRRALGAAGMLASGAALVALLALIWDLLPDTDFDVFERITASLAVVAVALPHACLLDLARLHKQYEWVRIATYGMIAALAVLICVTIWAEPRGDVWARVIGVLAIGDVCGSIATPILHRISGIRTREQFVTTALELRLECPRCGKSQTLPTGWSRCACGLRLRVDIEEEHCARCGYSLYRATGGVCPECGTPYVADGARGG
ncbi:MAG: hypothetical protein AB7Q17_15430 [Phycisphaerae bacterium]